MFVHVQMIHWWIQLVQSPQAKFKLFTFTVKGSETSKPGPCWWGHTAPFVMWTSHRNSYFYTFIQLFYFSVPLNCTYWQHKYLICWRFWLIWGTKLYVLQRLWVQGDSHFPSDKAVQEHVWDFCRINTVVCSPGCANANRHTPIQS